MKAGILPTRLRNLALLVLGAAVIAAAFAVYSAPNTTADEAGPSAVSWDEFDVLVFSRTNGWRHDSQTATSENAAIANATIMLQDLADKNNFNVTFTEDNTVFSEAGLANYEVVFFLNTTSSGGPSSGICPSSNWPGYNPPGVLASANVCGDMLTAGQQTAFENWFRTGKGWVGSHSASDTEKPSDAASNGGSAWPWYGGLLGNNAWFAAHGGQNDSACIVKNPSEADHITVMNDSVDGETATPSTWAHPAQSSPVQDEWYSFINNPLNNVTPTAQVPHTPINVVLYRPHVNNTTTSTVCANATYPASWYHEYDGGRAFYTARGHGRSDWREHIQNGANPPGINSNMRNHVLGGILYAAGVENTPDPNAPETTHTLAPAAPNGSNGWYSSAPTLTLTATDDISPVAQIVTEYRINGGNWQTYSAPVPISTQGELTVEYRSRDAAGNQEEAHSVALKVDSVSPSTSLSPSATSVTLTSSDATSGVASTQYCIGNGCTPSIAYTDAIAPGSAGSHIIRYRSTDSAGNVEATKEFTLEISKSDQSILIDAALPPRTYGDPSLTINARTQPNNGLTVTMAASGACESNATLVTIVKAGQCSLTFNQAGDEVWNPAPELVRSFVVNHASTSTSLTTKRQVRRGRSITLRATVNTSAPATVRSEIREGSRIDFFAGNRRIGRATMNSNGTAKVSVKARANWGNNAKLRAVYSGNDRFSSSTSSNVRVRVNR